MNYLQSNEVVFAGHPDRLCNQIGAAILQCAMRDDDKTRAGIEVLGSKDQIVIAGEITTKAQLNVEDIAKNILRECGVCPLPVVNKLGVQSADIALGVDVGGAGDQGDVFGAACDDNEFYLPNAQMILQDFAEWYYHERLAAPKALYPDGKAQITGIYDAKTRNLVAIKTVVISYQNAEMNSDFRKFWDRHMKVGFERIANAYGYDTTDTQFLINATGKFQIGGFAADAGVLGRKLVVDGYHGFFRTAGGATAGKDPTKVDFSAAIMARQLAKHAVKHGAHWAEVQISYCIGLEQPVGIMLLTDRGFQSVPEEWYEICKPRKMIELLRLKQIDYVQLARFGNFGRYEKEYYSREIL